MVPSGYSALRIYRILHFEFMDGNFAKTGFLKVYGRVLMLVFFEKYLQYNVTLKYGEKVQSFDDFSRNI